eukprot:TRINITY_DN18977_c0_g1_i5.p1 TRINITY_DN18977_c0_g1~~TRINITY_DN18977_c0_g1_i5.p1  ORF type:complete len:661 (+),score=221.05 TRINITY_DN18977_c0_g1_i5:174-2156(+)
MGVSANKAKETLKNLPLCKRVAGMIGMAKGGQLTPAAGKMLFDLASKMKNGNVPEETLEIVVQFMVVGEISTQEQAGAAEKLLNRISSPVSGAEVMTECGVGASVSADEINQVIDSLFEANRAELAVKQHGAKGGLIQAVRKIPSMKWASGKMVTELLNEKFTNEFGVEDKKAMKQKQKEEREQLKKASKMADKMKSEEEARLQQSDGAAAEDQVVTPWDVQGGEDGVDYAKLIEQFGCEYIFQEQIQRIEKVTQMKAHRFLRRGIFFSQKDFDVILDCAEKKQSFYLYTGRGPSSASMHLGHLVPFLFTKYLQEAFKVPLVIQMTDDEKFLFKSDLEMDHVRECLRENAKDIIALGFDPEMTFMFSDLDYITGGHGQPFYKNILEVQKRCNLNTAQKVFGFGPDHNIGQISFASIQASPSFPTSFPHMLPAGSRCLIPCAIDQDPYFRMTRDIAPRMKCHKPSLIHSKFFPAMTGSQSKMSSSTASPTTIFLTDNPEQIATKIKQYAFSGAAKSLAEHRDKGANLEVDVAYQYLRFFLEDDDKLASIGEAYSTGKMMTGEVKQQLVSVLQELVAEFQKKRAAVTEADVDYFMSVAKFNNQPERAVNQTTSGDGMAGLHEYLARHNLEGAMDEAANHVAKTQPADPMKALSEYFAKLAKR